MVGMVSPSPHVAHGKQLHALTAPTTMQKGPHAQCCRQEGGSVLDAKYESADLDQIARDCNNLTDDEQTQLLTLLHKYQHLFDGMLGTWNGEPYNIELRTYRGTHGWVTTLYNFFIRDWI